MLYSNYEFRMTLFLSCLFPLTLHTPSLFFAFVNILEPRDAISKSPLLFKLPTPFSYSLQNSLEPAIQTSPSTLSLHVKLPFSPNSQRSLFFHKSSHLIPVIPVILIIYSHGQQPPET